MPLDENDDDEELLGEDAFVKELREFDATASDLEKDLVKSIGMGKWGYLPQEFPHHIGAAAALSLVRVSGTFNHNGESFRNHVFVAKKEKYEPVSSFSALSALKVPKTEINRKPDNIGLDRDEIAKKSAQLAKFFSNKKTLYFKRTPKVNEAIGIFAAYQGEGMALDQALDKVQTKQTLKRAGQIVRLINKEQKSKGSLSSEVVETIEAFIKHMATFEAIGITLEKDSIQGVLYFAG